MATALGRARAAWLSVACLAAACSSGPIPLGRLDGTDASPSTIDAGGSIEAGDDDPCVPPAPTRHFTFDGVGTEIVDARGGASGRAHGTATLDGSGVLRLNGGDDYVDLPNGILAGLTEVSVAVWIRRLGGGGYTRIFDIGTSSLGEDPPLGEAATGRSYFAATPATGNVPSGVAVLMSTDGPPNEVAASSDVGLDDRMQLIVAVVGGEGLSLYSGATLVARVPLTIPLSSIVDHNAWLGRSQYAADPHIEAEYADLRIFDRALTACAVAKLAADGPNP